MSDRINLFMACNQNYLKACCATLASIKDQTQCEIRLYFAGSAAKRSILSQFADEVLYLDNQLDSFFAKLDTVVKPKGISYEAILRCIAPFFIPEKRLLWLDSDTISLIDVEGLFNSDLEGKTIGVAKRDNVELVLNRECKNYFNSGMVLFDLVRLKQRYSLDDIFSFIVNNHASFKWYDQDILNYLFCYDKALLDGRYNYQIPNRIIDQKYIAIENRNCIIHFWGVVKPWQLKYFCFRNKKWFWKYGRKSYGLGYFAWINILNYLMWPWFVFRRLLFKKGAD